MRIAFTKMNGAGNDFVAIDNRGQGVTLTRNDIRRLCDRQRGVGADGLFLLLPNEHQRADWSWAFFNNDGSPAAMCGNGARCFAAFARQFMERNGSLSFETQVGVIQAAFCGDLVTVNLTDPRDLRLNRSLRLGEAQRIVHSIHTGVPHAVLFVTDADQARVQDLGGQIRRHHDFAPEGTNVNFAQVMGPRRLRVRTYERGVERETLACGTGVVASAILACRVGHCHPPIEIQVKGGDTLTVDFTEAGGEARQVALTGPAEFVFEGEIEI